MKKKFFVAALAATMAVSSVMTASAADYTNSFVLGTNSDYTAVANPIAGKNYDEVTVEYTINWASTAAKNGWDGIFAFYNASTKERVSFQTAPYICYNSNGNGENTVFYDFKADGWCVKNCEAGTDYTFKYVINADGITITCNGEAVPATLAGSTEGVNGPELVLNAMNTCPELTLGVGQAISSFWWTELCEIKDLTISGTVVADEEDDKNPSPGPDAPEDDKNPSPGPDAPEDDKKDESTTVEKEEIKSDAKDGETVEVTIADYETLAGAEFVAVYYYDANGNLVLLGVFEVKDGVVQFESNGSDKFVYAVAESATSNPLNGKVEDESETPAGEETTTPEASDSDADKDGQPKTGDTAPIAILAAIATLAGAGVVVSRKKRA